MHKSGTTIEMMYTGGTVTQPTKLLNIRAIPGVTHLTMELPAGVLPNIRSSAPDMPCLMHAMNFLSNLEKHEPGPGLGPPTTIHMTPKDCAGGIGGMTSQQNSDCIDVVPVNCEEAAPLKRKFLNSGFQSYSLMQLEVDESEPQQPGRLVLDADISPLYLLNTHQQLRLQTALLQDDVTLEESLVPIVDDLCDEHEQLQTVGLSKLPAPTPLPYGTMQFHYNQLFSPHTGVFTKQSSEQDGESIEKMPHSQRKKGYVAQWRSGNDVDLNATIMALDQFGNYQPMAFAEWENMKEQQ